MSIWAIAVLAIFGSLLVLSTLHQLTLSEHVTVMCKSTLFHRVRGKALARRDLYQSPGYVLLYVIKFLALLLLTFSGMYGGSDDGYRPLSDSRHHSGLR